MFKLWFGSFGPSVAIWLKPDRCVRVAPATKHFEAHTPLSGSNFALWFVVSGLEHRYETALELVYRVDLRCVLRRRSAPFFEPDPLERVPGPSLAGNGTQRPQ